MATLVNDAHCHFFSEPFFAALGLQRPGAPHSSNDVVAALGWVPPGPASALAQHWIDELDRNGVGRAALIASVPGDEESVAAAVAQHPSRFVGFFMLDPTGADAQSRVERALHQQQLRAICLFPAMHGYSLLDAPVRNVLDVAARHPGTAVFVHCGALSVGVRKKLGLPSRFNLRRGNPLDVHALAAAYPQVPFIIPHFGAGMLREALMAADLCQNIHLDTSSSNRWLAYHPGLTLSGVFRQALDTLGPDRLLFGTDSSFFPRGWHRAVYESQVNALDEAGVSGAARHQILAANFERLFPYPVLS